MSWRSRPRASWRCRFSPTACADGHGDRLRVRGTRSMAAAPRCAATWERTRTGLCAAGREDVPAHSRRRPQPQLRRCGHHAICGPRRRWMIASAGTGSKGETRLWPGPGSPPPARRHWLLIRRHLSTGECALPLLPHPRRPAGSSFTRLITAGRAALAGRGELLSSARTTSAWTSSQVRLHTAITRHTVLVMARARRLRHRRRPGTPRETDTPRPRRRPAPRTSRRPIPA